MDSSTKLMIIESYALMFIMLIITIYFIIKILQFFIKKKDVYVISFKKKSGLIKKCSVKLNIITIILYNLWIILSLWLLFGSYLPDLLNVIKNKYEVDECIITNINGLSKNKHANSLTCTTDDNNVIYFSFVGYLIPTNTRVKVHYYKYLQIGEIIEIIN